MTVQYCFTTKFLCMKPIISSMGNIIPNFMQEYLLGILNYNLRMSNRAYVETKEPLFQIAPRRFKSAKLGVSGIAYSLVFNPHSFPLSVIPKNFKLLRAILIQKRNWNPHDTIII